MLLLATFCLLTMSIWPLLGVIIADSEEKFEVINVENINSSTVRIKWRLDEKLAKDLLKFFLVTCLLTESVRTFSYYPTSRSSVIYNVSNECNRNELSAIFTDSSSLECTFYLHHLKEIYTVDNQIFGCFKDDCDDILLLNTSSTILAISYGRTLYDFYILTRTALEWHDFRSTKSSVLPLKISDPIIKLDFDWLNELVLILTPSKIYQINIINKLVTHTRVPTNFSNIDVAVDPINGLIHILMDNNLSRYYTTIQCVTLGNVSFSHLKSVTFKIPNSCSLILDKDRTSIKILESNSLSTFQLGKRLLVKDFDLINADFQPPAKLQLKHDSYVIWMTNISFEFNENDRNVHTFHRQMDKYASANSINRDLPSPLTPFVILDSFYGDNFFFIRWTQPAAKWQSDSRWKFFLYKLQLKRNETPVKTVNTNKSAHFRFYHLKPNSNFKVTVISGRFSQTISGVTLNSKVKVYFQFYIINNGTVKSMNYSLRTFESRNYDSVINTLTLVKDVQMFMNCGFILYQNGFISRLVNDVVTHKFSIQNALKMEIDFSTGNIFFIDGSNYWICRYRMNERAIYTIDIIIPHRIDDFTLFPTLNVLVSGNQTGIYYTDLNGFPINHSIISEITINRYLCGDHLVEMIRLRNYRRILTRFNNGSRFHCRSSQLGVIMMTDSAGIYLRSWVGNGSLELVPRNHTGISALSIMDSSICNDLYVKPIQDNLISISRSNLDNIILSWPAGNEDPQISYFIAVTNHNRQQHWTFPTVYTEINLKNFSSCSDSIEISIKIFFKTTFSGTTTKKFQVPCITDVPKITDLFLAKKSIISDKVHKSLIEVRAQFQIYANTEEIDLRYPCVFMISFKKKFQITSVMKVSKKISCLDQDLSTSFEMDQNDRFELKNICGSIQFHNQSMEKCIGIEFMKTNEKEIIFSMPQKYAFSHSNQSILRIFIDLSGKSISIISGANNSTRKILISETFINKLDIDWIRNVLFWSERSSVMIKLFSVNLNGIKVNLREDRLEWLEGTGFIWSIDTIERKLRISINQTLSIINLDYGPEWHVDHKYLVYCDKLINHPKILKCTDENVSKKLVLPVSSYFYPGENVVVYENLNKLVCKIVKIKRNYVIPRIVSKCYARQLPNDVLNIHRYVMRLNAETLIDDLGNVYPPNMSNIAQCNIFPIRFNNFLGVKCYRNYAKVLISSSARIHIYKLGILYGNMESHDNHSMNLLDNPFNASFDSDIYINDLLPGVSYQFNFTLNNTLSNIPNAATCRCSSKDDVPNPPENVSISRLNFTHYRIMWRPGKVNGKKILDYKIKTNFQNYRQKFNSVKSTHFDMGIGNQIGTISIEARNNVGFSLPSYLTVKHMETKKQISNYYLHSTMTFSTSLFLIIVLISVSLILIISMYIHHRKRKRNKKSIKTNVILDAQTFELMNVNNGIKYEINSLYGFEKLPLTNFDKIPHILNECLNYSNLIGNGAFGMVFKGTMTVESDNKISKKPVALKIRNGKSIGEDDFKREAVLLFKYAHPNVVQLFGVSFDCPDKQCLILEYMEKGNLRQYLQHHRPDVVRRKLKNTSTKRLINENSILDIKDLINIAFDILEALKFLEEKNFVHRDIAARNCLVSIQNKNKRITKLGDFGLARDIYSDEYYRKTSETKLPIRWMAPETIKDGIFSGKSDVWSFGVLCWEIMTFGADPYMGQTNAEVVKDVIDGKQLGRPEICPIDIYEMMLQCWKYYPECRPSFLEIDLIFQYFDGFRDFEESSTLSRLVMRSYNSSHESEFGTSSDPITEKTSIALSEKYPEIDSLPSPSIVTNVTARKNYDNLGYEVPLSPTIIDKQDSAVFLHYSNDAT